VAPPLHTPPDMEHAAVCARAEAPLVLVADADRDVGRGLVDHLVQRGFRATHTVLGAEVLDLARGGRLGAVVVDVALSDMSGHALVSRLKLIAPRLPVLMTTGDNRPEFEVRARQIGILHYAQKPTDPERLEAVVSKALGVSRTI
jgi:DNA-binding NtrC family response regulator